MLTIDERTKDKFRLLKINVNRFETVHKLTEDVHRHKEPSTIIIINAKDIMQDPDV
jgi:hypothetical protein